MPIKVDLILNCSENIVGYQIGFCEQLLKCKDVVHINNVYPGGSGTSYMAPFVVCDKIKIIRDVYLNDYSGRNWTFTPWNLYDFRSSPKLPSVLKSILSIFPQQLLKSVKFTDLPSSINNLLRLWSIVLLNGSAKCIRSDVLKQLEHKVSKKKLKKALERLWIPLTQLKEKGTERGNVVWCNGYKSKYHSDWISLIQASSNYSGIVAPPTKLKGKKSKKTREYIETVHNHFIPADVQSLQDTTARKLYFTAYSKPDDIEYDNGLDLMDTKMSQLQVRTGQGYRDILLSLFYSTKLNIDRFYTVSKFKNASDFKHSRKKNIYKKGIKHAKEWIKLIQDHDYNDEWVNTTLQKLHDGSLSIDTLATDDDNFWWNARNRLFKNHQTLPFLKTNLAFAMNMFQNKNLVIMLKQDFQIIGIFAKDPIIGPMLSELL